MPEGLNLPIELGLVVRCLRAELWPAKGDLRIDALDLSKVHSNDRFDWKKVLFWARRHRVVPLVCLGFKRFPSLSIPPSILDEFRDENRRNAHRMLMLSGELLYVIREFSRHGIRVLPLKGPILSLQVHGDVALRQVHDLDLLLDPGNIDTAIDLLTERGYVRQGAHAGFGNLSAKKRATWQKYTNQIPLHDLDRGITVELHWNVMRELLPARLDEIWERTQRVSLAGIEIPVLRPADLVTYLSLHGAVHAWARLSWLVELARLITEVTDEQWSEIACQVRSSGLERPLVQGIFVSHQLFDTPIPQVVRDLWERDRDIGRLVEYAFSEIVKEDARPQPGFSSVKRTLYKSRLKLGRHYRTAVFKPLFFSVGDFTAVNLPDRLTWLYVLLRPLLWVRRHGLGRFGTTRAKSTFEGSQRD